MQKVIPIGIQKEQIKLLRESLKSIKIYKRLTQKGTIQKLNRKKFT